jgi:hypothetical protein
LVWFEQERFLVEHGDAGQEAQLSAEPVKQVLLGALDDDQRFRRNGLAFSRRERM